MNWFCYYISVIDMACKLNIYDEIKVSYRFYNIIWNLCDQNIIMINI